MKRKTVAEYNRQRQKDNEYQKAYRRKNSQLVEIWRQRSSANYLRKYGWTVTPPPGFPTLEEARNKRDFMSDRATKQGGPPVDLSDFDFDIDPDELPFP